jgi:site-specific DNA recombinase
MVNIKYCKKRKCAEVSEGSKIVWSYTRVSTKTQYDNNESIENQRESIEKFAGINNYEIAREYGGTYESASDDDSREEFSKLIKDIEKSKKKPFAILVSKFNRFSRTGGSAVGIVDELLKNMGVHLIETSTGLSTLTDRGLLEVSITLLRACSENKDRTDITVPAMKRMLKKGKIIGKAPRGYNHFGQKVKNYKFKRDEQIIEINEEGQILKKAWEWKIEGVQDFEIIKKLNFFNVLMSKQAISRMWRNPFYCGLLDNILIDDVVQGTWEPIVSIENFNRVNDMLIGKSKGYTQEKIREGLELRSSLYCKICESKITGYFAKKKYPNYKCQNSKCKCKDMNASSSTKSKGINDLFLELLSNVKLNPSVLELYKEQVGLIINSRDQNKDIDKKLIENELVKVKKSQELALKLVLNGTIKEDEYLKQKAGLEVQNENFNKKLEELDIKSAGIKKQTLRSELIVNNLSDVWNRLLIADKQRLLQLVFPKGLKIESVERQFSFGELNFVFCLN